MAVTSGRNTVEIRDGKTLILPVKAKTKIFEGSMVAIGTDGYAIPAKKAENLLIAGRAEEFVEAGETDATIRVRRGCFKWANHTSGTVTAKDILKTCYVVDAETVTTTPTGSSIAGKIISVDDDGVVVETM